MLIPTSRRLLTLVLAFGVGTATLGESWCSTRRLVAADQGSVALKVRRQSNEIDLMITGVGPTARVIRQQLSGSRWQARLSVSDSGRLSGVKPQQLSLAADGLRAIRLSPSDGQLQLEVEAAEGVSLVSPRVLVIDNNLVIRFIGLGLQRPGRQTAYLDLSRPGRVPQPRAIPQMQPRAVAPPVGDMAVGTMLINNRSFVNVSGPPVTLTLNNAPAKDALMSLARLGGYGFVYVSDQPSQVSQASQAGSNPLVADQPVTMAFRNERFDRALNSVLLASGLQAKLDGRTLMVGTSVSSKSFGPQMSKVFRMNQVKVEKAANYLASLGASISIINTTKITTGDPASAGTSQLSSQTSQRTQEKTQVETYGSSVGPLIGLSGTTDTRLGTVTLVGEPRLITTAESYLKQLDLRRRQVAVKVQILNVNIANDKFIDSSFSARMGDTFIVSDSGSGHLNFGQYKPGGPSGSGPYGRGASGVPGTYPNLGQVAEQRVIDPVEAAQTVVDPVTAAQSVVDPVVQQQAVFPPSQPGGAPDLVPLYDSDGRPIYVPDTNPTAAPTLMPVYDKNGQTVYVPDTNPTASQTLMPVYDSKGRQVYVPSTDPRIGQTLQPVYDSKGRPRYVADSNRYRQPDNSFYAYIEAQIVARNAKTLAQPTLLVQEGQSASVKTGEDVIINVEQDVNNDTGTTTYSYEKESSGLTLEVAVDKIDDNGFVTMNVNPSVSIPVAAPQGEGAETGGVQIFNLNKRDLKSGDIRLRDGQTLILTGVVSERQIEAVRKWPILGDLPLLGSLFRSTESSRFKDELVILVTPRVIDDEQGGVYGYGYRPGTVDSSRLLRSGS